MATKPHGAFSATQFYLQTVHLSIPKMDLVFLTINMKTSDYMKVKIQLTIT